MGIRGAYVERPAKHYNAAYGTFYDAIIFGLYGIGAYWA